MWSQSLDSKLLRNNFQKQLNDVVLDFTPLTQSLTSKAAINFWNSLKIT
jgi:hypothetical protein